MFKKSVFIMLFVCLMSTVCSAVNIPAEWWIYQLEWNTSAGDANWNNPANWTLEGSGEIPNGPDANNRSCVLPNQPGPRIEGNAKSYLLQMNAWDPTPWGWNDVNVTVTSTALDVNMGSYIGINASVDYDSYLGNPILVSRAIFNVYGGTVTTPGPYISTAMKGIVVGGGGSGTALAYGMLNIYGGEVNVPRLVLNYGEIDLSGGILHVSTDQNFVFSTTHPEARLNKLKINGGTLIIDGNYLTTDPCLPALIAGGYVVCERGTLGTPTYDVGTNKTTLVSDVNYCVWRPVPANNATNVHYKVPGNPSTTDGNVVLSWQPSTLEDIDVNHDVYFGTSSANVNVATKNNPLGVYMGSMYDANGDPCSFALIGTFAANTSYYWRVDEISNTTFKKGLVWTFKTHDGKAYNPKPVNGATALNQPLQLSWTAGDWADSHKVYFTTAVNGGNLANPIFPRPTDSQYRGQQTSTTYSLLSLAGAFTIVPGTTYWWCIDEVNGTTWKGPVWSFTTPDYTNIDDFEDSMSTEDVNANWLNNYPVTGCDTQFAHSGRVLYRDATGKSLQYTYNNSGLNPAFTLPYTEAKRAYPGGASFTGGGVVFPAGKLLQVDYRGNTLNPANPPEGYNPFTDNMYVAIEDTAGNVSVYLNPDANAQLVTTWTSWYTKLTDINAIGNTNLNAITGFALGFGIRCNNYDYDGRGDDDPNGVVFFDNIRLYGATCVPEYGPTTDMDGDCDVDINDLDAFSNEWLWAAVPQHSISYTEPNAPVIWYKFNESDGIIAADSASGYTADVCGVAIWEPTGGRNSAGCITLNTLASDNSRIEVRNPNTAFDFLNSNGGSISISVWINADTSVGNTMSSSWESFFTVYDSNWNERTSFSIPWRWGDPRVWFQSQNGNTVLGPAMPVNYFGDRWNHWAAVKDAGSNTMLVYCNGKLVGTATGATTPLFTLPVQSIRIGMRGQSWANWGKWSGKVQDFKVYDYALDANEVAYDATDGTGTVGDIPLVCNTNFNLSGGTENDMNQTVNFGDLAIMGQQWHTLLLYP